MKKPEVGMPVYLKTNGVVNRNWVGWVRRINWMTELAEISPESVISTHLSVRPFSDLVRGKFTSRMHPQLPQEIRKWKDIKTDDMGAVLE